MTFLSTTTACVLLLATMVVCDGSLKHEGPSFDSDSSIAVSGGDFTEDRDANRQLTLKNDFIWLPTGKGKKIKVVSFLCDEEWDETLMEAVDNWSKKKKVLKLSYQNRCPSEGPDDLVPEYVPNRIAVYPTDEAPTSENCAFVRLGAGYYEERNATFTNQAYITVNRQCYEDVSESLRNLCWTLGFTVGLKFDQDERKSCMGPFSQNAEPVGKDFKLLQEIYGARPKKNKN